MTQVRMKSAIVYVLLITAVLGSSISDQTRAVYSNSMAEITAYDAVPPKELKNFGGSCSIDVPAVLEEGELCATVVFDDATYGLTTEDKFSVLERKDLYGARPYQIYRITNSEKITAGNVEVHFLSWHKTSAVEPKYTCKLESSSTSSRSKYQSDENQLEFANVVNFAAVLTTADGIAYNLIGNFQGTCTFDVSTNMAKGELSVAVIFSKDTYGIQVGAPFEVLVRDDIEERSPQRIIRITNSQQISFDQLKIGFLGWYNTGGDKATYTCKLETV